jgi:predicted transcriptional regulator
MNLNFIEKHDHQLDYREKLDLTLQAFKNEKGELLPTAVLVTLNARYAANFSNEELNRVIEKLKKDEFLILNSEAKYAITIDGYYFIGYVEQDKVNNEKMRLIAASKARKVCRERSLNYATWFAGFAALLLLSWQIYSYYHPAPIPVNVKIQTE